MVQHFKVVSKLQKEIYELYMHTHKVHTILVGYHELSAMKLKNCTLLVRMECDCMNFILLSEGFLNFYKSLRNVWHILTN
jgi:hypothetical protein